MAKRIQRDFEQDIRRLFTGKNRSPSADRGLTADKMAEFLNVKKGQRGAFFLALSRMERRGELSRADSGPAGRPAGKKARYVLAEAESVKATMLSLSRGFGFARLDAGDGGPAGDCFIPGHWLGDALPGDKVLIALEDENDERGPSGRVVRVLEEGPRLYSGRLTRTAGRAETRKSGGEPEPAEWFEVTPDAQIRFPLPVKGVRKTGAQAGDKVRFTIRPDKDGAPVARLLTSYGDADSARICADAIVDTAGIPCEFPAEVLEEADRLAAVGLSESELAGREDLRDALVMTIDGQDAKDLDDAVSLEKEGDGWRLGVHIADVSHYVQAHTPLNEEAFLRGTSVYFADRVIPMLPPALSNGICSLNAGEDKLTLSVFIHMDRQGRMSEMRILKSVIRSRVRGVYSEVNRLFDNNADDAQRDKYAPVAAMLADMRALARILQDNAAQRGTMDIESHESAFVLDETGHPVDICPRQTGEAERLIEQFMIAANVAVATYARQKKLPFIYRVHEQPDAEKLRFVGEIAGRLGLKTVRLSAQLDMRGLMEEARETPYARLISDRLLRSMAKARYSENPLGHFGLALKDYSHFTSPIRRFPDLVIHRILSEAVGGAGKPAAVLSDKYAVYVQKAADQSSACEIRAMTAERDCESCYKAEYMGRFLGEEFDGVIASATSFGLFVELPNSVEGMIRLGNLPEEGLRYDDVASLVNERGKPLYTVGDTLRVRVDAVDVSSGRIDFSPVR